MTKKADTKAHVLVWVQFGALAVLFFMAGMGTRTFGLLLLEAFGWGFVFWAVATMRRNFRIYPEVAEGNKLVLEGPFKTVRHPVYTGMIILGFVWASVSDMPLGTLLWGVLIVDLVVKLGREEESLVERFGDAYREYQKSTKRLIPYIW